MRSIRILLADDHPIVLEGLQQILDDPQFQIVGTVTDGHTLVRAVNRWSPDIIIAAIPMHGFDGIEGMQQIREQNRQSKFIFLTMYSEPFYAVEALHAGASGYVLKSSPVAELITAIREVLMGRIYVAQSIAKRVKRAVEARSAGYRTPVDRLTPRQREVLQLLAAGRQVKEIALVLNVSRKTAEFHKYRIMDALGIRTVAELARFAFKHRIVE
jgi:DNA-binding NarL/FixJ family response regulator